MGWVDFAAPVRGRERGAVGNFVKETFTVNTYLGRSGRSRTGTILNRGYRVEIEVLYAGPQSQLLRNSGRRLGPVEIHRELMTAAARCMFAAKL